eukprot:scaffold4052_cov64-Attheya_sp.AAC.2
MKRPFMSNTSKPQLQRKMAVTHLPRDLKKSQRIVKKGGVFLGMSVFSSSSIVVQRNSYMVNDDKDISGEMRLWPDGMSVNEWNLTFGSQEGEDVGDRLLVDGDMEDQARPGDNNLEADLHADDPMHSRDWPASCTDSMARKEQSEKGREE